jgi:hypothetical protein
MQYTQVRRCHRTLAGRRRGARYEGVQPKRTIWPFMLVCAMRCLSSATVAVGGTGTDTGGYIASSPVCGQQESRSPLPACNFQPYSCHALACAYQVARCCRSGDVTVPQQLLGL